MLELLVEDDVLLEQPLPPSTFTRVKPVAAQLLEDVLELALAAAHDGRDDREPRPLVQREHLLDDLVERLPCDRAPAVGQCGVPMRA